MSLIGQSRQLCDHSHGSHWTWYFTDPEQYLDQYLDNNGLTLVIVLGWNKEFIFEFAPFNKTVSFCGFYGHVFLCVTSFSHSFLTVTNFTNFTANLWSTFQKDTRGQQRSWRRRWSGGRDSPHSSFSLHHGNAKLHSAQKIPSFSLQWRIYCHKICFLWISQCLKITQNVAFEFLSFGIFHQFLSNWNWPFW